MAEIRGRGDLEVWLRGKPRDWITVIVVRAALRTVPILSALFDIKTAFPEERGKFLLPIFRSLLTSYTVASYPSQNEALRKFSRSSSVMRGANSSSTIDMAVGSATSVASVAVNTMAVVTSPFDTLPAKAAMAISLSCNAFGRGVEEPWAWIGFDTMKLDFDTGVETLAKSPLWAESDGLFVKNGWSGLSDGLQKLGVDWYFWINWYQGLMLGGNQFALPDHLNEELFVKLSKRSESWWLRDPSEVNADIAAWLEAAREAVEPSDNELVEEKDLEQGYASHRFIFEGNKIVAHANRSTETSQFSEDLRSEALRKSLELRERLNSTQTPDHVKRTIDSLIDALGARIEDVRPGVFLSRSRSVDAAIAVFDTVESRDELFSDAQALLKDVSSSLDDLKAVFPEIARLEASALALRIGDDHLNAVQRSANEILETAKQSKIVDQSAIDAIELVDIDIVEAERVLADSGNESVRIEASIARKNLVALRLLNVRNFTAATVSAGLRACGAFAGEAGSRARIGALNAVEKGTERAVSGAIVGGVVLLGVSLFGPLVGLAALSGSFLKLSRGAEQLSKLTKSAELKAEVKRKRDIGEVDGSDGVDSGV